MELVEQGLLHYKSRLKELDRVAKGMGPPRKMHSVPTQPVRFCIRRRRVIPLRVSFFRCKS